MFGVAPEASRMWHDWHLPLICWPWAMFAAGSTVPQSGITSAAGPPLVSSWMAMA